MSYQKIAFHCGLGGNRNGIGDYFKALDRAGRPAVVCSYDDYGVVKELLELRLQSGVPHVGVFRPSLFPENPDYNLTPAKAGAQFWQRYRQLIPPEIIKEHTWLVWGNEGRKEVIWDNGANGGDWWGEVAVVIARRAMAVGYRTLAFGWSAGTPEEGIWRTAGMQAYLRLCSEHPNECGLAVHEGAHPSNPPPPFFGPLINAEPDISGRYQHAFQVCDELGLRRPRVFVTECAWYYRDAPEVGLAMTHVRQAAEYYDRHPEVLGVALWTTGNSGGLGEYGDVANKVQRLIQPITAYALEPRWAGPLVWPDGAPHYQGDIPPQQEPTMDQAQADGISWQENLDRLLPGAPFHVTWRFRNTGNTTWGPGYRFVTIPNTHPETAGVAQLPESRVLEWSELGAPAVPPGEAVALTVPFQAPFTSGLFGVNWQLQNPAGQLFGPVRWVRFVTIPAPAGDALTFVRFITSLGDAAAVPPDSSFDVEWELRNSGQTIWHAQYQFAFTPDPIPVTQGALIRPLAPKTLYTLAEIGDRSSVPPGESVRLRLTLQAPAEAGEYATQWQLKNGAGQPFGSVRWTRISVPPPTLGGTEPADYVYQGPTVTFFNGLHGPADDSVWLLPEFRSLMQQLNLPVLYMSNGINADHADTQHRSRHVVRLYWNPEPVPADFAYETIREDQLRRWWNKGFRRFIFFNEPQLRRPISQSEEGMGIAWHSAEEFARYLRRCLERARADFPGIQLYTTPMTPHELFEPERWYQAMQAEVAGLVHGWAIHAYTGNNNSQQVDQAAQEIASQAIAFQSRYQLQRPLLITEASVNRGQDAQQKARVARRLPELLRTVPGMEGVFWYAAHWHESFDIHHEGWFRHGIGAAFLQLT